MIRRQASLYVPEPCRQELDGIRKKYDPRQHALIPAHVTLCRDHEVSSWSHVASVLRSGACTPITLSFSSPIQLDDGCLMLPCSQGREQYRGLRETLLSDGGAEVFDSDPHITLIHPRSATKSSQQSLDFRLSSAGVPITFDRVCLIEQRPPQPWRVLEVISLNEKRSAMKPKS